MPDVLLADACRILGLTQPSDPDAVAVLDSETLPTARAAVQAYCGRSFTPITLTKYFDAPGPLTFAPWPNAFSGETVPGSLLTVPDLLTPTSVISFGVPLTQGPDYQLLTYVRADGLAETTRLLRMVNNLPIPWTYNIPLPWQPLNAISVTGQWGGYTTEPLPVREATLQLALRLHLARTRMYGARDGAPPTGGHTDPLGLFSADIERLLAPYRVTAAGVLFA